jgi:hypothetical protein
MEANRIWISQLLATLDFANCGPNEMQGIGETAIK